MIPVAEACPMTFPALGLGQGDCEGLVLACDYSVSAGHMTVMTLEVLAGQELTVPDGRTQPANSPRSTARRSNRPVVARTQPPVSRWL